MINFLTREMARAADRFAIEKLGIPGVVLMENAGRQCAERLLEIAAELHSTKSDQQAGVTICCGPGNNGGDGFVIARHLFNASIPVKVVLASEPEKFVGDAATNLRIIEKLPIPIVQYDSEWSKKHLSRCLTKIYRNTNTVWIVDAMLGTGAVGPLREPFVKLVSAINRLDVKRMAIDIPTGLDCDTGEVNPPAIKADVTCTFIETKKGFLNPAISDYLGHVYVIDIGAPKNLITAHFEEGES